MTDVPPARASRCSSACPQLEKGTVTKLVPPLLTAASIYHALRSSCAERDSTGGNFKLRRQNEAVRSDGRDSRGLPETCKSRAWRIRDPTWRKRDPTWRKSDESWRKGEFCWRIFFYSFPDVPPVTFVHMKYSRCMHLKTLFLEQHSVF